MNNKKKWINYTSLSVAFIIFVRVFLHDSNTCVLDYNFTQKEKIVNGKLKKYICNYLENRRLYLEKFSLQKAQKIKNTDLYKMISLMPKGSNLHLHQISCLSAEGTFEFCYNNPYVYINPKKTGDFEACSLYVSKDPSKVPRKFILFKYAVDKRILSKQKLLSSWVMDSYDGNKYGVWPEFHRKFKKVKALGKVEATYKDFYKAAILESIKDNTNHLELRINLLKFEDDKSNYGEKGIELLKQAYYEVKNDYPDFTFKIITAQPKNRLGDIGFECFMKSTNSLKEKIKDTYDLEHISDFIVGYDLVGEDKVGSLESYVDKIKALKNLNLIPYFHAGETDNIENDGIVKAYELGSKRIGHGTNLGDYPHLFEKFKNDKICLEVCPISEQILKLIPNIELHPAYKYFKAGIPIVIGSDDPFMFGSSGISFDFFEVIVAWNLDLSDVKQLIINSINYSALSLYEKEKAMKIWESKWASFIRDYSKPYR